jgi:hypothetical protein
MLHAIVHSAGIQDRDGGASLLATRFGQFPFLEKLFADSAYQGPIFANAIVKIIVATQNSKSQINLAVSPASSVLSRDTIAPGSPWQNGFAERLIGSIRRECVDHFVVLSEAHLRRILQTYAHYYNDIRTHWSLNKDAPVSRPNRRTGKISSRPIMGGLHHHYVRA